MRGRRIAATGTVAALSLATALAAWAGATGENYRFRRTHADDAAAAAVTLKRADLPKSSTVQGGPSTPDESPETADDACNGHLQVEHDLVVTGDAHSSFRDPNGILELESQVRLFRTARMAVTDFSRDIAAGTRACLEQTFAKDTPPEKLVSFRKLGSMKGVTSQSWLLEFSVPSSPQAPHVALALTEAVKGRMKAQLATGLAELQKDAPSVALRVQATALSAVVARMH
jgi:hypothetical protein